MKNRMQDLDFEQTTIIDAVQDYEFTRRAVQRFRQVVSLDGFEDEDAEVIFNYLYREMELVSEPVTAKASVGWEQGGEAILEEVKITSFFLRRFSADIACDNSDALFDYINGQPLLVVMEDGTEIELMYGPHYYALTPIALEQVAYVRLADGTKLEAPQ